jgi:hypothetical protein
MRKNYKVKLADGQTFTMSADMVEASASISTNWTGEDDGWSVTPYQTADAQHYAERAAKLCAEYSNDDPAGLTVTEL